MDKKDHPSSMWRFIPVPNKPEVYQIVLQVEETFPNIYLSGGRTLYERFHGYHRPNNGGVCTETEGVEVASTLWEIVPIANSNTYYIISDERGTYLSGGRSTENTMVVMDGKITANTGDPLSTIWEIESINSL